MLTGNAKGIELTSGDFVEYSQLADTLRDLNDTLHGALMLCMSSCNGANAGNMAMREDADPPFYAIVGNVGSPTWSDAAIAYVAFYHRIFKGASADEAIAAMKAASGDNGFAIEYGAETKESWGKLVKQVSADLDAQLQRLTNK